MLIVDRNSDFLIPFQLLNKEGGIINITSSTITCNIKSSSNSTENVLQKTSASSSEIEKTSATNGMGIVKVTAANTASLTGRDYYYEITDNTDKITGYIRLKQNSNTAQLITNRYHNLSSLCDDSNKIFTLSYVPNSGTLQLYLNGVKQIESIDYSINGVVVTMVSAPASDDLLEAYYVG